MDPHKGVIRWSLHRAREQFAGVLSTVVGIPVISAIVAAFVGLPPKPTVADQIENSLIGLGCGIAFTALVAALYAFLRAPYEQRAMLRSELSTRTEEANELESSVYETLSFSSLNITRNMPDLTRPYEYNHLQFVLTFRNDATIPIRFSIKSMTVDMPGTGTGKKIPDESYRLSAGQSNSIIIYCDFDSMQTGRAVGVLEYRAWYGPLSNPEIYEQNRRVQFTNAPDVDPKTSSTSYMRLTGGTDKRRSLT